MRSCCSKSQRGKPWLRRNVKGGKEVKRASQSKKKVADKVNREASKSRMNAEKKERKEPRSKGAEEGVLMASG
ncbi:hypothetical protein CEXT_56611 [Caerostris extrusa]|uniref:Uncharacterized protein n=1 Tax=Caerostris extrusa TaxID=172846 RepID=A0AAV4UM80_CAEEX|nr:hypothetical protein CEXT_56611 [Caerostris extrusa]